MLLWFFSGFSCLWPAYTHLLDVSSKPSLFLHFSFLTSIQMERQEEQEPQQQQQLIWESKPESMVSVTIGRAMTTVLTARPKKLHQSISSLSPDFSVKPSPASLDESLWFLHKYVEDVAQRDETLDEVLVPMIQHSMKYKDSKHGGQPMILLNWLFQDEPLFQVVAMNLANIIIRKDDRYIALGWCILVRGLLEYESIMDQYLVNGIKENYNALLKILFPSIPHLSCIVRKGSVLQDKFELPSRLSMAAADCLLSLTEGLTRKPDNRPESLNSHESYPPVSLLASGIDERKMKAAHKSAEVLNMGMEQLLWDHIQDLIFLVHRLLAWSRKSRPLHAKGLELVLKWLQEIQVHYGGFQDETGSQILKTRALLLSSCWKHYGMLLHLEDKRISKQYQELLDQYMSGIQYYTNNYNEGHAESKDSGIETRKFFLNCICLLLGRFDGKKFEGIVSEYGKQISHLLLSQLRCTDEDIIDGVVCVFKAIIFKPNNSSGSGLTDTNQMDAVVPIPSLLHLLDERDAAARAVVMLVAEYCSITVDDHCLQEVLKRLASGNAIQRRNAFDVISELMYISTKSSDKDYHSTWQVIANHLLVCLEDEETAIREQTPNLLPLIDPSFVLPALIHLVCSLDEKAQPAAREALIRVLKRHNQKPQVICMLLDTLSNLSQGLADTEAGACMVKGSNVDCDRVLRLIPEWSKSVEDWNTLIEPLIKKMFAEPSNATIVRFLSHINEQLAEAADVVLYRVVLQMKNQKEIDEGFFSRCDDSIRMQQSLFERLCPLLIIRLLPLRVFNDLKSSVMYGQLHYPPVIPEYRDVSIIDDNSVAAFLVNRAFRRFEFDDVRKLAAELCGRIHPQVLLPLACSQLKEAADSQDILKIKACLFSVCTSLVIRGKDSLLHPFILEVQRTIEVILLWPSSDGDEVSKAQHGCIDCLALMICAGLQAPESFKDCTSWTSKGNPGNATSRLFILRHVIHQLINDRSDINPGSKSHDENREIEARIPVSFCLCMANVLISACQKISDYGKEPLAKMILPRLIDSVEVIMQPEIRAACIQVLFSAVYHLKSAVLPYSSDLLKLSLKFLREGSEQEKMAGAKLMASLMASEDSILESISGELLEARSILLDISLTDTSFDIQQLCKKLLACITSS